MTKYFIAKCPTCKKKITGSWDWGNGRLCVQGYCPSCDRYILEDEANWKKLIKKIWKTRKGGRNEKN